MDSAIKAFFTELKNTCFFIDKEIKLLEQKFNERPDESIAIKKVYELQDEIKKTTADANALKNDLLPELACSRNFVAHFKDLTPKTKACVEKLSEHLEQYGYKPIEYKSSLESKQKSTENSHRNETNIEDDNVEENLHTPEKKISHDGSVTPTLIDAMILAPVKADITDSPALKNKKSEEIIAMSKMLEQEVKLRECSKDTTPTLENEVTVKRNELETTPKSATKQAIHFEGTPKLRL